MLELKLKHCWSEVGFARIEGAYPLLGSLIPTPLAIKLVQLKPEEPGYMVSGRAVLGSGERGSVVSGPVVLRSVMLGHVVLGFVACGPVVFGPAV